MSRLNRPPSTNAAFVVVSKVFKLNGLFVQLLLESCFVAFQVVGLKLLVPKFCPQSIDLVLELPDVPDCCFVPHFKLSVVVVLHSLSNTF